MESITKYQEFRTIVRKMAFLSALFIAIPSWSQVAPGPLFTYEGVLSDSSGNPITTAQTVTLQIIYPASSCVVYEETQTVLPGTQGEFSVIVGTGARVDSTGNTNDRIFASQGSFNCAGSAPQTVSAFEARVLHIKVGSIDLSPDVSITSVPFAINSQKLADKGPGDFVNVNNVQNVTQANVESIFNRFTQLDSILNNFNGTGTSLGANITGNAATATTAGNVTGTVALTNGGTGATSAAAARTNLGLGTLATLSPTGIADTTTYLRGDGSWQTVGGAVSSVAGKTGAVSLVAADVSDFGTAADARIAAQKAVASGLASLNGSGKVPSTQLALFATDIPNLDAAKITTGTFADARLAGMSIDKLINGATKYFNYKPNNVACADTEVLKYDSTLNMGVGGWKCATDAGVAAETDPTVQAFSKNAPSTGLTVNGTNQLAVTYGTAAGTAAAGNDVRITGALQSATAFSGDVSGTYNATSVNRIKGKTVSAAPTVAGQVLRYDGINLVPNFISMFDLRSTVTGAQAFGGVGCTAGKTLTWTAAMDNLACSAIAITSAQVSGLVASATTDTTNAANITSGTLAAARMPALTGDVTSIVGTASTMITNAAVTTAKIANGSVTGIKLGTDVGVWSSGGTNVYRASGNVGIGTTSPVATLDVVGDIKIGNSGAGCVAANEGQQRYNGTYHIMEFCNGTEWVGIGARTSCPTGYTLVGQPGSSEAFCIANSHEATTMGWKAAILFCAETKIPRSRLCTSVERARACSAGAITAAAAQSEWTNDIFTPTSSYFSNSATVCDSIDYYTNSALYSVRCCL